MNLNLFSIFDPSNSNLLSLNWMSTILFILFVPSYYWMRPSRMSTSFYNYIAESMHIEFKNNFATMNSKTQLMFLCLFFYALFNNFLGLFPYIFTATSHLSITLSLSLPFWLSFMLFGWINFYNHMFSHLVPLGTPMPLSSFMVFIETISNMIRPFTLAVRLTANMIAGHLLLTLLSNISENSFFMFPFTLPVMMCLLALEAAVAIIQSYVFITLLSLYFNEV